METIKKDRNGEDGFGCLGASWKQYEKIIFSFITAKVSDKTEKI